MTNLLITLQQNSFKIIKSREKQGSVATSTERVTKEGMKLLVKTINQMHNAHNMVSVPLLLCYTLQLFFEAASTNCMGILFAMVVVYMSLC